MSGEHIRTSNSADHLDNIYQTLWQKTIKSITEVFGYQFEKREGDTWGPKPPDAQQLFATQTGLEGTVSNLPNSEFKLVEDAVVIVVVIFVVVCTIVVVVELASETVTVVDFKPV